MTAPLIDPFLRPITYLRVSVTDRCDFRCVYCMAENMTFLPKKELLTLEELDRLCSAFIRLGVRKLRITGGEPLVRRDILTFFRSMSRHLEAGALEELTLTTNGSQLERFAADLYAAGVRRINVSLDTLDEAKFARVTRWGRLPQVLRGLDAAQAAGLRVKLNSVALKDFNEDELFTLTEFCAARGMDLTWIEVMPMGDMGELKTASASIGRSRRYARQIAWNSATALTDLPERTGGPARYVRIEETGQKIGFHHAANPQFLRKLQPGARDLHGRAVHVPRPGRQCRPPRAPPRLGKRRRPRRRDPRRNRTQTQGSRLRLFTPTRRWPGLAPYEPYRRLSKTHQSKGYAPAWIGRTLFTGLVFLAS